MSIKGDFEKISLKNLKMVCKELNKSGCIEESKAIDVPKLKKKNDLVEAFLQTVESIPEGSDAEANLPEKVVGMYNEVVSCLETEQTEAEPEAEPQQLQGTARASSEWRRL